MPEIPTTRLDAWNAIPANEVADVFDKVFKQTSAGAVKWTEDGENNFRATFPRSALEITFIPKSGRYGFYVVNSDGQIIGQLLQSTFPEKGEQLQRLYEMAKRRAYKIDETLTDLRNSLG